MCMAVCSSLSPLPYTKLLFSPSSLRWYFTVICKCSHLQDEPLTLKEMKTLDTGPNTWDAYQRNDFSKPRSLLLLLPALCCNKLLYTIKLRDFYDESFITVSLRKYKLFRMSRLQSESQRLVVNVNEYIGWVGIEVLDKIMLKLDFPYILEVVKPVLPSFCK